MNFLSSKWVLARVKREDLSLTNQVYNLLKDAINSFDLPPGTNLVESELSNNLGTSVTPIREALRRLESERLVMTSFGRSPKVRGFSLQEIREMFEVRAILESWAVREIFHHLSEENVEILEECMHKAEVALNKNDLVDFSLENKRFHSELSRHCGNDYLLKILSEIANQQHRVRIALFRQTNPLAKQFSKKVIEDHLTIIDAIRAQDQELTVNLINKDIRGLLNDINEGRLEAIESILDY